jgi:hypothetical protein
VVRLWRICRPPPGRIGGMAAGYLPVSGPLPEAGGALDQGAWLMAAFDILTVADLDRQKS